MGGCEEPWGGEGGDDTFYKGLYGEAPPGGVGYTKQ